MRRALSSLGLNLLLALAVLLTLAPLLWMVSASFMPAGEASHARVTADPGVSARGSTSGAFIVARTPGVAHQIFRGARRGYNPTTFPPGGHRP